MPNNNFFNEQEYQSRVKTAIVAQYFWAWANVIIGTTKNRPTPIAYLDLFAGPGRYLDGAKSTPVLILEQAIQNPDMQQRLITMFNDKDSQNVQSLQVAISAIPGIETLKHKPVLYNAEVGDQMVKQFEQVNLVPTLFFVDPWGYKGLSLRLVNSVLKDWGCDCIFFFNYNRINMGLSNEFVTEHMNALFGEERANRLRTRLQPMVSDERELAIVEEIAQALKEMGGKYVLPFRFRDERGTRTSHHLVFVSKHFRGYEIMKDIMAKQSSSQNQGVPSFEYSPTTERQPLLFNFSRPLDDLGNMLLDQYNARTVTMQQIYEEHSVDLPYTSKNYKDCLKRLEAEGKVVATPSASERRKDTFADSVNVSFPK